MTVEIPKELIQIMWYANTEQYNVLKTAEECAELQEKLIKSLTKRSNPPADDEIIEEIGDVILRAMVLSEKFGMDKVLKRIEEKSKLLTKNYKDAKKGSYTVG